MRKTTITSLPRKLRPRKRSLSRGVVGVIGYGNQGKSQALNLRDSGFKVQVGNIDDSYAKSARADGFKVQDIPSTVRTSSTILLLLPDEIQPEVFRESIEPDLTDGQTLVFASGYNYFFGHIRPKDTVGVSMLAPAMIGWGVRERFLQGDGFPVLVAVGRDVSGDAHDRLMVLADGIGAFRPGGCAIESSFEEETLIDLLSEHTWAGAVLYTFRAFYEVITELGFSGEAAILEMYGSGELADIATLMARYGLFKSLKFHSHTSQYGQLTRGPRFASPEIKEMIRQAAREILDGTFSNEWSDEQVRGMRKFERLKRLNSKHPMERTEERLYDLLKRTNSSV